jgi:hypothetical protein
MPAKWFGSKEEEPPKRGDQQQDIHNIEIKPELIEAAMKPHLDAQEARYSAMMDEKLKAMNDFFADHNRRQQEAARKQQADDDTINDMDYINDPGSAIDKKLAPLIRNQQAANAMIMINETLGEMDYYKSDPEFKAKVLAKINSQPLALRSNADIILNCYKLVRFDEDAAIKEGKYKSIIGAASTSGTGGHSGSSKEAAEVVLSDEEKSYAKKMGIKEEDWIKSKKTLEYV